MLLLVLRGFLLLLSWLPLVVQAPVTILLIFSDAHVTMKFP